MIGLNTPVSYAGTVTTIDKLAQAGIIRFRLTANVGEKLITEYHAMTTSAEGWRISKLAYFAAIARYPELAGEYSEPEPLSAEPYTFAEYDKAIRERFAEPELASIAWLVDVDSMDWRKQSRYLLHASPAELGALAERIETLGNSWDETQEAYHGA